MVGVARDGTGILLVLLVGERFAGAESGDAE
jgi:hypothetical protein